MTSIALVFPRSIRHFIESMPAPIYNRIEEVRIRQDRPLEVITSKESGFVHRTTKRLTQNQEEAYCPTKLDCEKMINLISRHSLYTMEEELRRGYITITGGHRVGIAGRVVVENGKVKLIRDITGFNVRFARAILDVGRSLIPYVIHDQQVENLLIVSPPQCGKTTLIRDLARLASTGTDQTPAYKVGIIDERSEIAGCLHGVPQHDVGPRTDVLDACPKAEGMMMMIRSMSPEILVVDEIGHKEDSRAVFEAIFAGVRLFTTAHAYSLADLCRRPTMSELVKKRVFTRIVVLSRRRGPGTVEAIYDQSLKQIDEQVVNRKC